MHAPRHTFFYAAAYTLTFPGMPRGGGGGIYLVEQGVDGDGGDDAFASMFGIVTHPVVAGVNSTLLCITNT